MAERMHQKDYKSLEEIWNDLLRLHWDYLDTEENMHKLEMRKTLEGMYHTIAIDFALQQFTQHKENPFEFFILCSRTGELPVHRPA